MQTLAIFLAQIILLFFLSHQVTREFYYFLNIFSKNKHFVFSVISLIYLPGTLLHEMAHFLTATVLMLKVREIKIFPEFRKDYIRLGSVIFEKKDFIRGILVGISPVFMGLFCFFILSKLRLFPSTNLLFNLLFGYFVFAVSSTMFSSRQDLIDLIYIIPLVFIIWGVVYLFQPDFSFVLRYKYLIRSMIDFIVVINYYLLLSIIINLILVVLLRTFYLFSKK